ncbi:hypothetical protein H0H93_014372, partial [Arthromyces matolae]
MALQSSKPWIFWRKKLNALDALVCFCSLKRFCPELSLLARLPGFPKISKKGSEDQQQKSQPRTHQQEADQLVYVQTQGHGFLEGDSVFIRAVPRVVRTYLTEESFGEDASKDPVVPFEYQLHCIKECPPTMLNRMLTVKDDAKQFQYNFFLHPSTTRTVFANVMERCLQANIELHLDSWDNDKLGNLFGFLFFTPLPYPNGYATQLDLPRLRQWPPILRRVYDTKANLDFEEDITDFYGELGSTYSVDESWVRTSLLLAPSNVRERHDLARAWGTMGERFNAWKMAWTGAGVPHDEEWEKTEFYQVWIGVTSYSDEEFAVHQQHWTVKESDAFDAAFPEMEDGEEEFVLDPDNV